MAMPNSRYAKCSGFLGRCAHNWRAPHTVAETGPVLRLLRYSPSRRSLSLSPSLSNPPILTSVFLVRIFSDFSHVSLPRNCEEHIGLQIPDDVCTYLPTYLPPLSTKVRAMLCPGFLGCSRVGPVGRPWDETRIRIAQAPGSYCCKTVQEETINYYIYTPSPSVWKSEVAFRLKR